MTDKRAPITSHQGWPLDRATLLVGAYSVPELAERFGTPFYAYDLDAVRSRARRLKAAFPRFEFLYSVKSNPNAAVCRLLASEGFGAGVSSASEIRLALKCGYAPADVGYVGPGKTAEDLDLAVRRKVGIVYVESEVELERLTEIARRRRRRVKVALRVNTKHRPSSAGELMAGGPSPFGIDEEALGRVVAKMDRHHLRLVGIHTFVASQVLDAESLLSHFERVTDLATAVASDFGFHLELVNYGGGFGVPYSRSERALDVERLGASVEQNFETPGQRPDRDVRAVLEVGRFLVAEAGLFVARVVDVKQSRGSTFVITDSGISGFARPAMPWAQPHPCSLATKIGGRPTTNCRVVGPSCMPGDVLSESVQLADPVPGDLVVMYNAGAYGLSMSMVNWGGFPAPVEVVVDGHHVAQEAVPPAVRHRAGETAHTALSLPRP